MAKLAKKESNEVQIIKLPIEGLLEEVLAPVRKDAEETLAEIRELSVETPTEMSIAGEMLKEVAYRHAKWDAERKELVEPLKTVAGKTDAIYRPVLKALVECVEILKTKLGNCYVALDSERTKVLKASTLAGASKKAEALVAQAAELIAPDIDGVGIKPSWTGGVTDASLLPREYLLPDVKRLEEVTAAMGRDPEIPGWSARMVADVRTTRQGR